MSITEPAPLGFMYKLRVYTAGFAVVTRVKLIQLFRSLTGRKHPKGWPADEEVYVEILRAMIANPWQYVRAVTTVLAVPDPRSVIITPIAATDLKVVGGQQSYWFELKPELQPQDCKTSLTMMYIHGGGFVFGDSLMYKHVYPYWLRELAKQGIHMKILSVGYPLAPEHPFPQGLHAVVEAYDWLVGELGSSDKLIVAGDSAGGNLVVTSLVYMRERARGFLGSPESAALPTTTTRTTTTSSNSSSSTAFHPPLAAIMISPAADWTEKSEFWKPPHDVAFKYDYLPSYQQHDATKLFAPPASGVPLSDPFLSPIFMTDFSGLVKSRMLVVTGGCELLAPDIHRFVDHMRACNPGIPLQHHVEPDEPHVYPMLQVRSLRAKGAEVILKFVADVAAAQ